MAEFQQLMTRFLETQQSVMLAYLQGTADAGVPDLRLPPAVILERPAPTAPPPVPARRALESPKGPEEPVVHEAPAPPTPPVAPVPPAEGLPGPEQLTSRLLSIVSERTGYPTEILNLDLDLEAELGIDSIKRVEILGNFHQSFGAGAQIHVEAMMEQLVGVKTLRGIVEWIAGHAGSKSAAGDTTKSETKSEPPPPPKHELRLEVPSLADQDSVDDRVVQRYVVTALETPHP
jgi:acyl carrier protein